MKYTALLLTCAVSCSPVLAAALGFEGGQLKATPEELVMLSKCSDEGGCLLLTRNTLLKLLVSAAQNTCRKDMI
jgi:hypothetical protein